MKYDSSKTEQTFATLNLGVTTFVINTITNLEATLIEKDEQLIAALVKVKVLEEKNTKLEKELTDRGVLPK